MIIGIVGSRSRDTPEDYEIVADKFFELYRSGDIIVSGGCPKGGDRFAEVINKLYDIPIIIHYPKWKKYGSSAAFVRNSLVAGDSDVLIACINRDRDGGTEDTIRKYIKLGKLDLYKV